MVKLVRHRQRKRAETDRLDLTGRCCCERLELLEGNLIPGQKSAEAIIAASARR